MAIKFDDGTKARYTGRCEVLFTLDLTNYMNIRDVCHVMAMKFDDGTKALEEFVISTKSHHIGACNAALLFSRFRFLPLLFT